MKDKAMNLSLFADISNWGLLRWQAVSLPSWWAQKTFSSSSLLVLSQRLLASVHLATNFSVMRVELFYWLASWASAKRFEVA